MRPKHQRLLFLLVTFILLSAAAALILSAFKQNLIFFYTPSELAAQALAGKNKAVRIGGLVKRGTVKRDKNGTMRFIITDLSHEVVVYYKGLPPSLFREGQGVVVTGKLRDGVFEASEVLAKHDENYMPPEVADALRKSGRWRAP